MNTNINLGKELYKKIREKKYRLCSNGKYYFPNELDSTDMPELIYHYTTYKGFESIVSEQRLRLTGNTCLNDPAEYQYAKDITVKRLEDKWLRENHNNIVITKMIELLNQPNAEYPEQFILSFSEKCDDLNQWRCYGDNGFGICFGYRSPAPRENYYRNFHKLLYDESDQINWIDFIVEEILKLKLEIPPQRPRVVSPFNLDVMQLSGIILFCMKHHAYKDESEWRFMTDAGGKSVFSQECFAHKDKYEVKIYDGGLLQKSKNPQWDIKSTLAPKYKYYFKPAREKFVDNESELLPINEVWLGPCSEIEEKDVIELLSKNGYAGIDVKKSKIPYSGIKCNGRNKIPRRRRCIYNIFSRGGLKRAKKNHYCFSSLHKYLGDRLF